MRALGWVVAAALACVTGCGDGEGSGRGDADAAPRRKPRTVTIELFKTAVRGIERGADGAFAYVPLADLGGVEVCVAQQRPAFALFQPFELLDPPICVTSIAGQKVVLEDVPADSDLVITLRREGYEPGVATFRTDAFDIGLPTNWGTTVTSPLVAEGAREPWYEQGESPAAGDGVLQIDPAVTLAGPLVAGPPNFINDLVFNVAPAEGVTIEVARPDGSEARVLTSQRERPHIVVLPEGSHRLRFSHPRLNVSPIGDGDLYMITGFSTDRRDTIEVPVLAGHVSFGAMWVHCASPDGEQLPDDLAICSFADADGGAP